VENGSTDSSTCSESSGAPRTEAESVFATDTPLADRSASRTARPAAELATTSTGATFPGGKVRRISCWPCTDSGACRYCSEMSR
jgi:hypothetical protein